MNVQNNMYKTEYRKTLESKRDMKLIKIAVFVFLLGCFI